MNEPAALSLSRRRLLRWVGVGAVSGVAAATGLLGCDPEGEPPSPRDGETPGTPPGAGSTVAPSPAATLAEPEVVASTDGLLDVELRITTGVVELAGRRVHTAAYNGTIPGPTLLLRPGDRVRIRLVNGLDEPTNLHFHGLHVPPDGQADNIFVSVASGDDRQYDFRIPDDHPAGTFWYHPHRHGLVADQVFAGLYGVIIIQGGADDRAAVSEATQRLLVLSDVTLTGDGAVPDVPLPEMVRGREGDLVLVNGQHQPQLTAAAGSLERWRILNASVSRFYRVQADDHPLHVIGSGAAALARPERRDEALLAPGQRVEVMVEVGDPGTYRIRSLPYDRGRTMPMNAGRGPTGRGGGGMGPGGRGGGVGPGGPDGPGGGPGGPGSEEAITLATLHSEDGPAAGGASIPDSLVPVADLSGEEIAASRTVEFDMSMGPGGPRFLIDGRTFDADRIDNHVRLGTTEDWVIRNRSSMDHPFHLHTWPFQVLDGPEGTLRERHWQDVVNVPAGRSVRVRIPFRDFGGRSVHHCHILDHEDLGMMAVVEAR